MPREGVEALATFMREFHEGAGDDGTEERPRTT
jgi:hypothetical protein